MKPYSRLFFILFCGSLLGCSNGTSFGVGEKEDNFSSSIIYNNKVDIVWLIDDSSSMLAQQQKLSNEISAMIAQLNLLKMDYRMVVTTTSIGSGLSGGTYFGSPAVLTSSTPNLVNVLKERLLRGQMGSNLEQGLQSLQNLFSEDYINQAGAGFHRDEALLLINVLSDEDDQSPGSQASVVLALKNRLNTLKRPFKPNVGGWLMNFIGVVDTTCQNGFGQSLIGFRYLELVAESKGKSYPICSTALSEAVKGLQARVLEIITDYPLSAVPDISTIRVFKNGLLMPRSQVNGWDYIPASQVIRFYGTEIPAVDSAIRIEFLPASAG